ncbi:hypothetical protein [Pseudonocardia sp. GCM10023141]|uniref:hypothetical protein n=1 Tax=Pseudonocardia sp. GCM10023141 TaxID=3252653 RepID=UPI00361E6A17
MNKAVEREQRRQALRSEMERTRAKAFRAAPTWRTRIRRRLLAGVVLAIIVASVVLLHLLPGAFLPIALLFVVGCVALVGLRLLTRGVAEGLDAQLDERDRALRDRAVRTSHLLTIGGVAALTLYVAITQGRPDLAERTMSMLVTLAWSAVFAPTLVLAWTLPDDDPEDLA